MGLLQWSTLSRLSSLKTSGSEANSHPRRMLSLSKEWLLAPTLALTPTLLPGGSSAAAAKEGGKKGKGGGKKGKQEAPKPAAAAEEVDEMDLFGDEEPAAAMKKKAEADKAKKKKAAPVAKSLIIWEVKPWGEDTDLTALANKILGIEMDGLFWKTEWKKEPVAY